MNTTEEQLQELIRVLKYTRWNYDQVRRETYPETIDRVMADYQILACGKLTADMIATIKAAMLDKRAFGSMRMLAMAGAAFNRSNLVQYNCAAMPIDRLDCLHDLLILGMSGVGVTYSVERRFTEKLPVVRGYNGVTLRHTVADSTEGWARGLDFVIRRLFDGYGVILDYSQIRPAGTPLRTKGGRASGPEPLQDAVGYIIDIIRYARGRKLTPLEWSDICCWIGEATVQGGVRRTALMALFDADDSEMLNAKRGAWWVDRLTAVRRNANFSQVICDLISRAEFMSAVDEMLTGNGEPGFFNRSVAHARRLAGTVAGSSRCKKLAREHAMINPCGEALLSPFGLCNLSVAVARAGDTEDDLCDAVTVAAILGALQTNATYFPSLKIPAWRENAELFRQAGVCLTGIADCEAARDPGVLQRLQATARQTLDAWAARLDIPRPLSATSVKPAGNTALFTNSSPGINARHYPYALRRVTLKRSDPVVKLLAAQDVPLEQSAYNVGEVYAVFPIKAPAGALIGSEMSAIEQMELYLTVLQNYSDQAVSNTITFQDGEEEGIKAWLWEHREEVVSMTFLKDDGEQYPQMIIEQISAEEYEKRAAAFPDVDWSQLAALEVADYTEGSQELGCSGGVCSIVL